ncbi:MAG TPA: CCA tRNA nucleotidyltransferase [Sedimentibacter sp.]|jgi:tRNA nucleotidyltransferase (CCA-adding enzyme)|nr:CCA tRNA nucleotidyltransferase [Sedimentibacter sp.]HOK49400.1 CCA tRNA nucleotidyltransferase [Sedimentibacter sp.]HOW23126.1 CCA tRNA nucleotidyltransferase [Sedimentibacter sp.]
MKIIIPGEVVTALDILQNNGFEAYIVGGCVRDSIMGKKPSDWDIATSARPEEILECFNNYRTIETGLKHGTVTVIVKKMQIEITTYRIDGEYSDRRRPDKVTFTNNIDLDLQRRDFTINALAYNQNGIIDIFGGLHDIKNKIVKCVGHPDDRFNEDGLRILRALRFASVLNFSIDDQTSDSIFKNKALLHDISTERINMEFNKLIMGINYQNIIFNYRDIIEVFLPEIKGLSNEELRYRLNSMKELNSLTMRLAVLLQGLGPTDKILMNLKYDNKTVKTVKILTENINEKIYPDPVNIKRWLNKINSENLVNLIKIKKAMFDNEYEELAKSQVIMKEILASNQCYNLRTLAINGQDLLDAGMPKGKRIGMILNKVLNEVIEGKLENKKDILLNYVYGMQKTVDKQND